MEQGQQEPPTDAVAGEKKHKPKRCWFGAKCNRSGCPFIHPKVAPVMESTTGNSTPEAEEKKEEPKPVPKHKPVKKNKPCRYGAKCRKQATCPFAHPVDAIHGDETATDTAPAADAPVVLAADLEENMFAEAKQLQMQPVLAADLTAAMIQQAAASQQQPTEVPKKKKKPAKKKPSKAPNETISGGELEEAETSSTPDLQPVDQVGSQPQPKAKKAKAKKPKKPPVTTEENPAQSTETVEPKEPKSKSKPKKQKKENAAVGDESPAPAVPVDATETTAQAPKTKSPKKQKATVAAAAAESAKVNVKPVPQNTPGTDSVPTEPDASTKKKQKKRAKKAPVTPVATANATGEDVSDDEVIDLGTPGEMPKPKSPTKSGSAPKPKAQSAKARKPSDKKVGGGAVPETNVASASPVDSQQNKQSVASPAAPAKAKPSPCTPATKDEAVAAEGEGSGKENIDKKMPTGESKDGSNSAPAVVTETVVVASGTLKVKMPMPREEIKVEEASDDEVEETEEERKLREEEEERKARWREELRLQKERAAEKKKQKKKSRHEQYMQELERQTEERRLFWKSEMDLEARAVDMIVQFCAAEFCRHIPGLEPMTLLGDNDFKQRLQTVCQEAFRELYDVEVNSRVVVKDNAKQQDLNDRAGVIHHWDESKGKFYVGLETKKGKMQYVYVPPENLEAVQSQAKGKKQQLSSEDIVAEVAMPRYGGSIPQVVDVHKVHIDAMMKADSVKSYLWTIMEQRNKKDREERQRLEQERREEEKQRRQRAARRKAAEEERRRQAELRRQRQEQAEREYAEHRREQQRQGSQDSERGHDTRRCNCPDCRLEREFMHRLFEKMFAGIGGGGFRGRRSPGFSFGGGAPRGGSFGFHPHFGFFFMGDSDDSEDEYFDWDEEESNAQKDEEAAELLGVDVDASATDIKRAYRRLARLYHPDSYRPENHEDGITKAEAEEHFKKIADSYEHLMTKFE